eukprot:CAMPEP_0177655726 /NCGR_PEP_ID=MMETSP0447-20121125/15141_1 /TAXON_ID=0 /ORGANISM="Stygamoeba regulata, Strain BSH-02190019" /LENGTH=274 /DNA_ID=CAMNT_0019159705 /DNA_START=139 /DNA_END=963 /DNA_ORIENTATION=+
MSSSSSVAPSSSSSSSSVASAGSDLDHLRTQVGDHVPSNLAQTVQVEATAASGHSGTVLLLHGLGDSGAGWLDAAQYLSTRLPHLRFVLPTAPQRPVTLNMGMRMPAWYDLKGLDDRDLEHCEGIDTSASTLFYHLVKEAERLQEKIADDSKSPSSRIVVGGFSQGAATSLYAGYQCAAPLAGVFALSGYLPKPAQLAARLESGRNRDTPLLMCHGTADPMVRFEWGKRSFEALQAAGVKGEFKAYRGMQHSACVEELDDLCAFLKERLPPLKK